MAKVFIEEATLTAIGDAIRAKTGKTALIDPAAMHTEIASIEAGSGGGAELPEEAFLVKGDSGYRFANGSWDWFIDLYGNRVTSTDITSLNFAFQNSKVTKIPFTLNIKNMVALNSAFNNCANLAECPKIRGNINVNAYLDCQNMIANCKKLINLEDLFEPEAFADVKNFKVTSEYSAPKLPNFMGCASLRAIPTWWRNIKLNPESTAYPAAYAGLYNGLLHGCYLLDEATNITVLTCAGAATGNMFSAAAQHTDRLKTFTFETDNGQPIVVKWKSQTLDLSSNVGYGLAPYTLTGLNTSVTTAKEVKDDATYQAFKNDPDWFTSMVNYSRYNHDSAVETINSLPDASAYLATAGGTNTIKFKKTSGSATDGGAIENLTAEEIAVATAKGWTVTLV